VNGRVLAGLGLLGVLAAMPLQLGAEPWNAKLIHDVKVLEAFGDLQGPIAWVRLTLPKCGRAEQAEAGRIVGIDAAGKVVGSAPLPRDASAMPYGGGGFWVVVTSWEHVSLVRHGVDGAVVWRKQLDGRAEGRVVALHDGHVVAFMRQAKGWRGTVAVGADGQVAWTKAIPASDLGACGARRVAYVDDKGTMRVLESADGREAIALPLTFPGGRQTAVCVTSSADLLAVMSEGPEGGLRAFRGGSLLGHFPYALRPEPIVEVGPGKFVAVASDRDGKVGLLAVDLNAMVREFKPLQGGGDARPLGLVGASGRVGALMPGKALVLEASGALVEEVPLAKAKWLAAAGLVDGAFVFVDAEGAVLRHEQKVAPAVGPARRVYVGPDPPTDAEAATHCPNPLRPDARCVAWARATAPMLTWLAAPTTTLRAALDAIRADAKAPDPLEAVHVGARLVAWARADNARVRDEASRRLHERHERVGATEPWDGKLLGELEAAVEDRMTRLLEGIDRAPTSPQSFAAAAALRRSLVAIEGGVTGPLATLARRDAQVAQILVRAWRQAPKGEVRDLYAVLAAILAGDGGR